MNLVYHPRTFLFFALLFFSSQTHAASVCAQDVCVKVEVVSKSEDLARGLQGREGLAADQGMLFVFEKSDFENFWMKDMKFPIDIIWLNDKGRIVTIAPSCPPCSKDPCQVYAPNEKASYVLEVPSGFTAQYQWKIGDILEINNP